MRQMEPTWGSGLSQTSADATQEMQSIDRTLDSVELRDSSHYRMTAPRTIIFRRRKKCAVLSSIKVSMTDGHESSTADQKLKRVPKFQRKRKRQRAANDK